MICWQSYSMSNDVFQIGIVIMCPLWAIVPVLISKNITFEHWHLNIYQMMQPNLLVTFDEAWKVRDVSINISAIIWRWLTIMCFDVYKYYWFTWQEEIPGTNMQIWSKVSIKIAERLDRSCQLIKWFIFNVDHAFSCSSGKMTFIDEFL